MKPSLAPLVPRCLSFCDPDSLQLDFVGVVWSLRFSHLHDFLWPFKSKLNAVNKENWCVKYRNMNNLLQGYLFFLKCIFPKFALFNFVAPLRHLLDGIKYFRYHIQKYTTPYIILLLSSFFMMLCYILSRFVYLKPSWQRI